MASSAEDRVLSPAMLAHVVLRTNNFREMVTYYKQFLGAHASFENDTLSFLRYDEEHHRIAILGVSDAPNKVPGASGLEHTAFTFKNLDDLMLSYTQRKKVGILPTVSINHGPTTSIYYTDPDGNMIETQVDNFNTADEASEYMASPEFEKNPIGIMFDPEELIKRLKSGESHASIKKRGEGTPVHVQMH